MKLLRTVRFDASDEHVYARAAVAGEWAVSGLFAFQADDSQPFTGKTRQAFANGFLGLASFGRSTFAVVTDITAEERAALSEGFARHLVEAYGAPDIVAARPVAEDELAFTSDLCREAAINTVFTVRRTRDEAGAITEEFRTILPPSAEPRHARIWTIEPDET